ncbi:DUF397 domain-containing protein [Sphaerisporangium fuscum]|uniref:DUF397 domain-containing protein n=1 Tax=Sphaerisporangium fuscum TaxID=2835868 RepID=UPI0035573AEA
MEVSAVRSQDPDCEPQDQDCARRDRECSRSDCRRSLTLAGVRDSRHPERPALVFPGLEGAAFLERMKNWGEPGWSPRPVCPRGDRGALILLQ